MGLDDVIERVNHAGDAHRRTMKANSRWLPAAHSPLWRVYYRFCEEVGWTIPAKVGRCVFWEIVLILAPLRRFGKYMSKPTGISFPVALLLLAFVAGAGALLYWLMGPVLVIIIGGIIGGVGVLIGLGLYIYLANKPGHKLMKTVRGILSEDDKISWGALITLLLGQNILVGLLVGYLVHNLVFKPIGWVIDETPLFDFIEDHFWTVLKPILWAAGIFGCGWLMFNFIITPYGWLVLAGFVALCALTVGLLYSNRTRMDRFATRKLEELKHRSEERRYGSSSEDGGRHRKPSLLSRIGDALDTAFETVCDVVRLMFEAIRYGYKRVCDLAPVPDHLLAEQEKRKAEEAERAKNQSNDEEEEWP